MREQIWISPHQHWGHSGFSSSKWNFHSETFSCRNLLFLPRHQIFLHPSHPELVHWRQIGMSAPRKTWFNKLYCDCHGHKQGSDTVSFRLTLPLFLSSSPEHMCTNLSYQPPFARPHSWVVLWLIFQTPDGHVDQKFYRLLFPCVSSLHFHQLSLCNKLRYQVYPIRLF